jgi:hypothetical protein
MRNTNSRGRTMQTALLGLLLACSVTACSGGPTEPSDLARSYTGRWRGNINGFEVVFDLQASDGDPGGGLGFRGTGTARSATGELHRLRMEGGAFGSLVGLDVLLERGGETGPASVFLTSAGDFHGVVSGDGRTWPGRFTSEAVLGGAPIFGPGEYAVTWLKD